MKAHTPEEEDQGREEHDVKDEMLIHDFKKGF
jgi:hypothetical protein